MLDNEIPIFIICRDRLEYLKALVHSLKTRDCHNIHLVDNKSTYPELLDYYLDNPDNVTIHKMDRNYKHSVMVDSTILDGYYQDWYAYSDCDVVLDEQCPNDFMTKFKELMLSTTNVSKVGPGLRIDDLPDCYKDKNRVILWESQFWKKQRTENVYHAPIDTTFALCRPGAKHHNPNSLRTGFPYVARHLPWYADSNNVAPDVLYYVQHSEMLTNWNPNDNFTNTPN